MNYDLYRELKEIADQETVDEIGGYDSGYEHGQIDLAKKVLNAYAKDNGKKPAPYPEVE